MAEAIAHSGLFCSAIAHTINELVKREQIVFVRIGASRVNILLKDSYAEFSLRVFIYKTESDGHMFSCIAHATSVSMPVTVYLYTLAGTLVARACTSIQHSINVEINTV
jgi:hypothetical protein